MIIGSFKDKMLVVIKKMKKINFSGLKKNARRIFIALFSLLTVFALTATFVIIYVAGHIVSFTNGEAAIDLDEYKINQSQTSFVYAYDKTGKEILIEKLHGEENRVWANLEEMSPNILKAFVSLEDKRFKEHKGVDWYRFMGVITKYSFEQGASTITQQLIKNLTGEKDVTVIRKFNEILSALNLENHYSKDTILETYLNTVALGSGCYGVKTAAEKYFGKDVSELNLAESAALAAITKAPFTFDPLRNPQKNKDRQEYCLSEMLTQGTINKEEYDEAVAYNLILTNSPGYVPDETAEKPANETSKIQSFYVDFVINNVISDFMSKYGITVQQATRKLYTGGIRIYAAVDMDVQKTLEDVYYNRVTFPKEKATEKSPAVQSAMTVMDYEGRVVGIVGQAGPKLANRTLNRAADSPRQPGSTLKPLAVYAPAVELNYINWSTKILDYAFPYQGLKMWPKNVDGTLGSNSTVTVQKAIEKSLNTVAARVVVDKLTPNTSMSFLSDKFHFSTLDAKNDPFAAPMAVGALTKGLSSLEMTAAYAAFGNGGKYYKPYSYYKVTDSSGKEILLENDPVGEQILAPETADVMCELLQTVDTKLYGSGSNVRKFQIMAKTGTSDSDNDRWFCAGTPYYVSAVWYGYDRPRTIPSGLNPAAKIFIEVYDRIHKGLDSKKFPKSGLTVQKSYCTSSGLLAGTNCTSTASGWYKISNMPGVCTTCTSASSGVIPDIIDDILDIIVPTTTPATTVPATTSPNTSSPPDTNE
jgi:penicillin-binding protein 1A